MSSCTICCEKIRALTKVSCSKCDAFSCRACFQTYLLNSPLDVSCMHCRMGVDDEFVNNNTGKSWRLTVYKTYRENKLFDMEKARLPETQPFATAYLEAKKLYVMLDKQWQQLLKLPYEGVNGIAIRECQDNRIICLRIMSSYGRENVGFESKKSTFIKGCPADGCRGFLGEDFVCGLCSVNVCSDCHEIRVGDHVCNADTVASVKALLKESKSCPTCASVISKIDGCDQMWCTQCQTAFSWTTGLVEQGRVHNPHFYEWARRNGGLRRETGDNCGMPSVQACLGMFDVDTQAAFGYATDGWDRYRSWWRHHGWLNSNPVALKKRQLQYAKHKHVYEIPPLDPMAIKPPAFPTDMPTDNVMRLATVIGFHRALQHRVRNEAVLVPDNHKMRVELLLGKITEDKMRVSIQMGDKAFRKHRAVQQINEMVNAAAVDIFRNYVVTDVYETFFTEINALINYANGAYEKVSKTYNNVIERIVMEL